MALADFVLINIGDIWHRAGCMRFDRYQSASDLSNMISNWTSREGILKLFGSFLVFLTSYDVYQQGWALVEINEPSEIQYKSIQVYVFSWKVCLWLLTDCQRRSS